MKTATNTPLQINDDSWFYSLLGLASRPEQPVSINGKNYIFQDGILRAQDLVSADQKQTEEMFGFKWSKTDTFESDHSLERMRDWLNEKYKPVETWINEFSSEKKTVLDAGCGASMSGYEYFAPIMDKIKYVGADISTAIDVSKQRSSRFPDADIAHIQCDLNTLPFQPESFDAIFSEGVLHHTDSTKNAIANLRPLVKPGGLFMFYIYKEKGPIREYTDDMIRDKVKDMPPQEAWDALMPLTKLGKVLGDLDIEIDIPEEIDLLEIPAGKINLQRFVYWHVMKCFYRPEMSLDEMNHINFDWYTPINAWRQTPEDVAKWCHELNLKILDQTVEEAGITVITQAI